MKGIVSFYEKPGCRGNALQKEKLVLAGYKVQVIDMLSKKWEEDELKKFFGKKDLHKCINMRAPAITSGMFEPHKLTEAELMESMLLDPILIKRPLIFYKGEFAVGFENDLVTKLLGEKQEEQKCHKNDECHHD